MKVISAKMEKPPAIRSNRPHLRLLLIRIGVSAPRSPEEPHTHDNQRYGSDKWMRLTENTGPPGTRDGTRSPVSENPIFL